jgi:hypothetical protein
MRALTNRNFAVGCFLSFVTGVGIFSTIYLTPLFLGLLAPLARHFRVAPLPRELGFE